MFDIFSSHTEWFFAILSLLGVSLVAVLRAVFGKTKLEFEFCVIDNEDSQRTTRGKTKNVLTPPTKIE
jgi:cytochrome c biogenesis protein ResB